jgi:hypothetical protein
VAARRNEIAAMVLFASVLILRAPWVFFRGRFWAEEATMFFGYALSHSFWDALTATHAGYYNFVGNFSGILATTVPLEYAPRVTVAIALGVYLLPAGLLLFGSIPGLCTPLGTVAALALLLVAPANPEVYLITINAHFVLCATTGLVLVCNHGSRAGTYGKYLLLALAGLTGVVSTFLTPFFWWQWWKERRRERLIQAAILSVCALVQLAALCRGMEQGERQIRPNAAIMAGAIYAKLIAAPLAPTAAVNQQMGEISQTMAAGGDLPGWVWAATFFGLTAFLILCWTSGNRASRLLAAASIWVSLLASPGSREAGSDQSLLYHLTGAIRYYYAPEVFFFLALLLALGGGTRWKAVGRTLGGIWLGVALAMGLFNFLRAPLDWQQMFFGPSWKAQVEQWRKDPSQPLAVWPAPWHLNLPPPP